MMKKNIYFLILYILGFHTCFSQNLVPNPSFEELINCPVDYGLAANAKGWGNFHASPDLFSSCTNGNTGVPENFFGEQYAASGKVYAGLVVYHAEAENEIIGIRLLEPLQPGQRYEVSFKISLAEKYSRYAGNGLGVLFTDNPASTYNCQRADMRVEEIIKESKGWVTMSRVITADRAYTHIAIGNFFSHQATRIEEVRADAPISAAYYYIDDIYVVKTEQPESPSSLNGNPQVVNVVRDNPYINITGKVFDAETKQPIAAQISLIAGSKGYQSMESADQSSGLYQFLNMPVDKKFTFQVQSKGYFSASEIVENPNGLDVNKDFYLTPLKVGQKIVLEQIYFDFGTADLKPISSIQLDRMIKIMKENPSMHVLISGHTDDVGTDESNITLSDNRAKAVVNYIVSKGGIDPSRLSAKGFGENKPITENETEEGRARNRRVEFEILKL